MTILNQRSEQWGQRNESKLEVTNTEMAGSLMAPNVEAPFRGLMTPSSARCCKLRIEFSVKPYLHGSLKKPTVQQRIENSIPNTKPRRRDQERRSSNPYRRSAGPTCGCAGLQRRGRRRSTVSPAKEAETQFARGSE
jgi:hypothetical protein